MIIIIKLIDYNNLCGCDLNNQWNCDVGGDGVLVIY